MIVGYFAVNIFVAVSTVPVELGLECQTCELRQLHNHRMHLLNVISGASFLKPHNLYYGGLYSIYVTVMASL